MTEKEDGPENTVYRETVLRYCLLSYILCVRRVSEQAIQTVSASLEELHILQQRK